MSEEVVWCGEGEALRGGGAEGRQGAITAAAAAARITRPHRRNAYEHVNRAVERSAVTRRE